MAWFPALTAVTPRAKASCPRRSILTSAPLALKGPRLLKEFELEVNLRVAANDIDDILCFPLPNRCLDNVWVNLLARGPEFRRRLGLLIWSS